MELDFLYIPIWLYSNECYRIVCDYWILSLHSNLVIFKYLGGFSSYTPFSALHSNLVIFKLKKQTELPTIYHLYIPIWLYSNPMGSSLSLSIIYFTFQSGYIQIDLATARQYFSYSLHSNLVIFKFESLLISYWSYVPLHSNLVIFKLYCDTDSIHMFHALHSNLVIFK